MLTKPLMPEFGASIKSFLAWENESINWLGNTPERGSVWGCWQANEGICTTAKEQRFDNYQSATEAFDLRDLEIAKRRSGGTTVPHGNGILAITYIAKSQGPKNIRESYLNFCAKIQAKLDKLGFATTVGPAPGAYCDGDYNILLDGLKLAGTSQRWTRSTDAKTEIALNHAVMLVTRDADEATERVNDFHHLAQGIRPFAGEASSSLWASKQNTSVLKKSAFFDLISTELQTLKNTHY